ncbi:MAG: Group intron-encoded protein LtrA [Planctomycetota bacterium]|jgi:RNA-directed DNA polymerase
MSSRQPVRPSCSSTQPTSSRSVSEYAQQAPKARQANDARESDDRIVPANSGNSEGGKAVKLSRDSGSTLFTLSGEIAVIKRLERISQRAESHPGEKFNNLLTLITLDMLDMAFSRLKSDKSPGIDGQSVGDYGTSLEENLHGLLQRLHRGSYRPKPSLRKEIPKENGKTRPLGMACVEDKIVQRAIVMILERIYEVDFYDNSYGYRPGKSCDQALGELGKVIATRKVNWISDSDIQGFFDNVNHQHLMAFLSQRISDPRLLRLIQKFLDAGVMIEGRYHETDTGVAQGSVLSPLLANVYLHYVLDQWFEQVVKTHIAGEAYLFRFADDFICCFQQADDAKRYQSTLEKRLGRFGLNLAPEKTKLIRFGRFAARDSKEMNEGAPKTFDFLGFTHYCGRSRAGKFKLKRRTSKKKFRAKVQAMSDWLRRHLTTPLSQVWESLQRKLQGHYQYYGINDNWPWLMKFRTAVKWRLFRWLRRRSQTGKTAWTWETFYRWLDRMPLASPVKLKDLIAAYR